MPTVVKAKIRSVTDLFYNPDRIENKEEKDEEEKRDDATVEDKLI